MAHFRLCVRIRGWAKQIILYLPHPDFNIIYLYSVRLRCLLFPQTVSIVIVNYVLLFEIHSLYINSRLAHWNICCDIDVNDFCYCIFGTQETKHQSDSFCYYLCRFFLYIFCYIYCSYLGIFYFV